MVWRLILSLCSRIIWPRPQYTSAGLDRYGQPLRVVALNVDEGWSQDVSEAMARKVLEIAEREDYELTQGTLQFLEAHSPSVVQPTLPAAHVTGLGGP
jgi:hypothetical protein